MMMIIIIIIIIIGDYFVMLTSSQPNPILYAKQNLGKTLIYKYNNSVACLQPYLYTDLKYKHLLLCLY